MFAPRDDLSRSVSDGSQPSTMVSGTSAREEGLRTLTSPRREASLFKLGRSLWFRPFSFLPFPATSDACREADEARPSPARGVARANPLPMTLQFDGPHAVGCGKSRRR